MITASGRSILKKPPGLAVPTFSPTNAGNEVTPGLKKSVFSGNTRAVVFLMPQPEKVLTMESIVKIASAINKGLCCALLVTMVCFVFANTALRYFFNSGIIITEELVRYLFLWAIYLGIISVWFTRGHIRVTTVTDRLSPRQALWFSIIFEIVAIVVLLTLSYGSYLYYIDTTTVGQVTGIPYSIMILAVLVGTLACAIISFGHIKQDMDMLKLDDATLAKMAAEAANLVSAEDEERIRAAEQKRADSASGADSAADHDAGAAGTENKTSVGDDKNSTK